MLAKLIKVGLERRAESSLISDMTLHTSFSPLNPQSEKDYEIIDLTIRGCVGGMVRNIFYLVSKWSI